MSSSSHEVILTSSPDGPIIAYEASNGTIIARFTGSRSPCRGLSMVGQGLIAASHVFSDTGAGSIHLYNWYNSTTFNNLALPEPVAPLIATSEFLFVGGLSGTIHSLLLPFGNLINSFSVHSKPISSHHLTSDESLVIVGTQDGTILVIPTFSLVVEASSSTQTDPKDLILNHWKAHSDSVSAFNTSIGLCSSILLSCSLDCTCKFWSLSNGILIRTVSFPCAILGAVVDTTESEVFAGGADGLVYKWNRKDSELVTWSKSHNGSIVSLGLVNEGRNLVSAAEDGSVWMWDIKKGQVTMVLQGNDMGSISDMIVVRGTAANYGVVRENVNDGDILANSFTSSEQCDEEIIRTLNLITELRDVVDVVEHDKKRVVDKLEYAIALYQRLLKLILKESMKAINDEDDDDDGEEEEEEEKDKEKENDKGKDE